MCKLILESVLIRNLILFDSEFNSLSDGIIFKEGYYVKIRSLGQSTSKITSVTTVINV